MIKPTILFENIIRFKRVTEQNILSYKIFVKETNENGETDHYLFKEIDNPMIANPVQYSKILNYIGYGTFQLDDDIYLSANHTVKVYINEELIPQELINYDPISSILSLDLTTLSITKNDKIETTYYIDEIEVKHSTNKKCNYYIMPVIDSNSIIGKHNVLR